MAAGSGAASGHGARSSTTALEASLDRRFQGVSNTMESIQGLSTWCIENKKHHGLIVRYWMKWLKKSDNNHRLNLFYLANDVIQNCKRKNAIVFRSAFAEVLPNAILLIKDGKVRKSVERIFSIWEERSVYPEEVIAQFKASFNKKEKEREKHKEKEKEKEKETPPAIAPTNTKAALKSKIVAEFTPHSLIEQLSKYKRAVAEEEFREKQLAALRVDVCSTEALKRLKDKAGGNKFAKDFEDGSLKLQEFVSFLEKELKTGPPLLEALGNADIFYEMQYKEVKIVANAYNAFASRVASLKRKLDSLKSTLPGPEDSPIPSPSEDAPSPTGSDSPFLGLGASRAQVDPELDGKAMDDGEIPIDNRDMEDMDMSDEEADAAGADEKKDKASTAVSKATKSDASSKPPTTPTKASKTNATTAATATPGTPTSATAQSTPTTPLGVNLAKVDLGKISSILSSLTSAMKNTASPSPRPSPGTPTTPSAQSTASKATPPSPALASILSRVDITPEGILNALSKTNTPGLSSLLQSVTNTASAPPTRTSPESSTVKTPLTPTTPKTKPSLGNNLKRDMPGRTRDWEKELQLSPPPPPPPRSSAPSVSPPSLESKINSFLQGNPGFSLALGDVSPDGVDGTPVRDEAAGTPTQDEMMDTPGSVPESLGSSGGHNLSPTAYRSEPWDAVITPSGSNNDGDFLGSSSSRYGAGKKNSTKLKEDEAMNVRRQVSSSPSNDMKGKKDGHHSQLRMMGINRAMGERRLSASSRKASTGSDDGGLSGKREDKGRGQESPGGDGKEGQYHRIETLVSPCTEGAPIQTLGYSNRPLTGERIKTVESIRVIGRGSRRGGGAGGRPGGVMWYEEEEYMEAQPPSPHTVPPPLNIGQGGTEDMTPSMPPPHPQLLLPHLHPPPSHPHSHPPPQAQYQMPYHTENIQTPPPSLLHQHPPPTSPFFSGPPPMPRPPPPPIPQRPSPPPNHPVVPSAVMVGGVLVPVDRPLSLPPPIRPEGGERGGVGPRGNKVAPPPLMTSLLGEPPQLPRPGTVKEAFVPRHAPPLHRPGTPGVPPPLLGRVKEPLNLPLPSPSPSPTSSTTSPSTPNSPAVDTAPTRLSAQSAAPPLQKAPTSPPAQPRTQTSNPVPLLNLPTSRPPILSVPISQRPLLRGRTPSQQLNQDPPMGGFRGGKRPGPPFTGGPFHHGQKRPFLPPRY
ncbi:regulation of nuclear pre-mRNA domain-containing protein 2-like isoform X3 [Seriola lalandi dorsalis]|uniref:regulation of nuclear pre-mRNA domain-containing protein 2-like isoform X3 n=1 Tax=Seriola lalandi dorsalis TaxID=1841481 RepID=UPI000C6F6CDB|nr:regulation of nuclear pre-mRNA domain-containing protein 2-like isoform X3 [Seriola lalandi dorsalis]